MAQSNRLALSQVRLALRLVGECRDVGHDPQAWLGHAMRGLGRLLGSKVVAGGITPPEGFRLHGEASLILYTGWEGAQQEQEALQYLAEERHLQEAAFQQFQLISTPNITLRPLRLISRQAFLSSENYAIRRHLGIEDFLFSQRVSGSGRATVVLSPQRAYGDPAFSARDLRLIRLFHDELTLLVGTVLSDGRGDVLDGLPPRLRQTLAALLEGDGEKQAALRLGISRHTVHEYITALYRRFQVNSRGELLALCLRKRIGSREALGKSPPP